MLALASGRGSWVVSLAVLGLACSGIREDPSPSDNAPPKDPGSQTSGGGGAGSGGGVTSGGGASTGGSAGFMFDDCACASIIEGSPPALCSDCVEAATSDLTDPCKAIQVECDDDLDGCGLARSLLLNNPCDGDPACVAELLVGLLDDDSASVLFGYYACLCNSCTVCNLQGLGGGGGGGGGSAGGQSAGGGSPIPAESCVVQ